MESIEINKIYCEDHLVTMSKMPDDFIDLTVTSPPYDNLRDYNGYVFQFEKMAKELYRVTKPGGVVVWVVNDETKNGSESLTSCKQKIFFREECGFNIHDTMIYWKNGFAFPEQNRYAPNFEYMFILSKGVPKYTNIFKIANNRASRIKNKSAKYRTASGEMIQMKYETGKKERNKENIWIYEVGYAKTSTDDIWKHPAPFPEKLAADHIYSWSNEGDLVYDPMAGSGTVPKMAIKMKRKWIASEISQEYCDIAEKRIKREQSILKLF